MLPQMVLYYFFISMQYNGESDANEPGYDVSKLTRMEKHYSAMLDFHAHKLIRETQLPPNKFTKHYHAADALYVVPVITVWGNCEVHIQHSHVP